MKPTDAVAMGRVARQPENFACKDAQNGNCPLSVYLLRCVFTGSLRRLLRCIGGGFRFPPPPMSGKYEEDRDRHEKRKEKMFCRNCGNQIDSQMAFCMKCGAPVGGGQPAPVARGQIKNHMVGAILQLIVCIPAGIAPLIYACKVNEKLAQGDIAGAQEASRKALKSINIGTAIIGGLIILSIIGNVMSSLGR